MPKICLWLRIPRHLRRESFPEKMWFEYKPDTGDTISVPYAYHDDGTTSVNIFKVKYIHHVPCISSEEAGTELVLTDPNY